MIFVAVFVLLQVSTLGAQVVGANSHDCQLVLTAEFSCRAFYSESVTFSLQII